MNRQIIPDSFNQDQKLFLSRLIDDVLGSVIVLDSDITTAGKVLNPNEIGFNSTTKNFFINLAGTVFKVLLTEV